MQIYWVKVKNIIKESSEVRTFHLECPEGLTWEEGTFAHLAVKGFNEGDKPNKGLVRHMSINTVPEENVIGITTRIKEDCSEYKAIMRELQVGDEVAMFKIYSHAQLRREGKNIYLLSSGVGLATCRSLALTYLNNPDNINKVHSLSVDSSGKYLFTDVFESNEDKNFGAQFVDNRSAYYEEVRKLADSDGIYYVIGSDDFLRQNIKVLRELGISNEQIVLDKRKEQMEEFLTV